MSAINSVSSTTGMWTATSRSSQQINDENDRKKSYTVYEYELTNCVSYASRDGKELGDEEKAQIKLIQQMIPELSTEILAEQKRMALMWQEQETLGIAEQGRELKGMFEEAISRAGITMYTGDGLSIDLDANNRVVVTGKIADQDKLSALQEILTNDDSFAKKLAAYRENIKKGYEIEERWGQDLSVGKRAPVIHLNTNHSRDTRASQAELTAQISLFASDPKIQWTARPRENFIRFEGDENPKLSPEEIVRQKRQEYLDEAKKQFDAKNDKLIRTYTVYR